MSGLIALPDRRRPVSCDDVAGGVTRNFVKFHLMVLVPSSPGRAS